MLIGNSLPETIFIHIAVPAFRLIAPVATVAAPVLFIFRRDTLHRHPWLWPVGIWLVGEAVFCWAVYIPLRLRLQRPAEHPNPPPKERRERLMQNVFDHLPDPEYYLTRWFMDAPSQEIKRENVKEFFAWSALNKRYEYVSSEEDIELNHYTDELEEKLSRSFESGRGKAKSLRTTIDPVPMQHRPLVWYFIVAVVESFSSLRMAFGGYRYYRASSVQSWFTFPVGLHRLPGKTSASSGVGYWHRSHASRTKPPIVFIHGIGIGIYTYVGFLQSLAAPIPGDNEDDGIGVIAIELESISSRLCAAAPSAMEVKEEVRKIMSSHGWDEIVLVGHSYGTGVVSTMLQDPTFAKHIKATVLLDPICLMLHLPDVAYNFTRRLPKLANERMLYYFASQDMMISHTLARRFFWNQLILFLDDIPADMPLTVSLSGRDLIVPTGAVWTYLTGTPPPVADVAGRRHANDHMQWAEGKLRVHWFSKLDHAGLFANKGAQRGITRETHAYCEQQANGIAQ